MFHGTACQLGIHRTGHRPCAKLTPDAHTDTVSAHRVVNEAVESPEDSGSQNGSCLTVLTSVRPTINHVLDCVRQPMSLAMGILNIDLVLLKHLCMEETID